MKSVPLAAGRGCDYSFRHPDAGSLRAAGIAFVLRYLSGGAPKQITKAELDELWHHGIGVGFVFEVGGDDIAGGTAAGKRHAVRAQAALDGLGLGQALVYFAVDEDVVPGPRTREAAAYFAGIGATLPANRVGVYGDSEAFTAAGSRASRYWQSNASAWSHGVVDPRAHVLQGPSKTIAGAVVDLDRLVKGGSGIVPPPTHRKPPHKPIPKPPAPKPGRKVWRLVKLPAAIVGPVKVLGGRLFELVRK